MSSNIAEKRYFKCPCGKSYLSYPALFTHIKQKHDGMPPGSVVRPKTHKRGRPRKNFIPELDDPYFIHIPNHSNLSQSQRQSTPKNNEIQQKIEKLTPFYKLNRSQYKQSIKKKIQSDLNELLKTQEKDTQSYASIFLVQKLIAKNNAYAQAIIEFNIRKQLYHKTRPLQISFQTAMLQFMNEFKKIPSWWSYKHLEIIIALMIYFYRQQIDEHERTTSQNYVKHINTFIDVFIERLMQQKCYKNVFSLQRKKLLKVIQLVHQWLLIENLSTYQIQINNNQWKQKRQVEAMLINEQQSYRSEQEQFQL